jgi:RNA-binding protein
MSRTKKDVMREATELDPTIHVGKDGVTDSLIGEVKLQMKTRKVVKVKLLPSAGEDKKALAMDIAARSNGTLVDVRGSIATLCDKRYYCAKPVAEPRE